MPSNQISIKHNKHRVHPCPNDKKLSLLAQLIAQNSTLKTVVAVTNNIELIKEAIAANNVTILNDEELAKATELECELLISYDLPSNAAIYMSRLAKATDSAIVLLDISEQKHLYPIETLLRRVIKQEIVVGFEYEEQEKMKIAPKPAPKREYAFNANADDKPKYDKKPFEKPKRDGKSSERKPFEKPKYDKKPFEKPKYDKPKRDGESSERKPFEKPKQDKKPNKFLGKDENGKAKFSGKSGERNHRHDGTKKETTEAPKNVGRIIPIKARKPKEDSKPSS
ncbi:MAG: hypothetical protein WC272_04165 [Sulfurimonas sp.]|jgi:hypothetical protein